MKSLGMKLGMHLDLVSLGIFGYALMTSETLADAVHLVVALQPGTVGRA